MTRFAFAAKCERTGARGAAGSRLSASAEALAVEASIEDSQKPPTPATQSPRKWRRVVWLRFVRASNFIAAADSLSFSQQHIQVQHRAGDDGLRILLPSLGELSRFVRVGVESGERFLIKRKERLERFRRNRTAGRELVSGSDSRARRIGSG